MPAEGSGTVSGRARKKGLSLGKLDSRAERIVAEQFDQQQPEEPKQRAAHSQQDQQRAERESHGGLFLLCRLSSLGFRVLAPESGLVKADVRK